MLIAKYATLDYYSVGAFTFKCYQLITAINHPYSESDNLPM